MCREFKRVIGDGLGTQFWKDNWAEEGVLGVKFNRLFRLSVSKEESVGNMGHWEVGGCIWDFKWSRNLLARESLLLD